MIITDLLMGDMEEWREPEEEDWLFDGEDQEQEEQMGKSCPCGCHRPYTRPGTSNYLKAHMDCPISSGIDSEGNHVYSDVTAQEFYMVILQLHLHYSIGKECMDVLLALFASVTPGVHFIPRSIHLLKEVTETPEHWRFMKHACAAKGCPGHVYEDVTDYTKWLQHETDKCPKCDTPRFKITEIGGKQRAEPRFPFHYLGVENAILQQLLANPKFRDQRANIRDTGEGSNGASLFNGKLSIYNLNPGNMRLYVR